MVELQLKVLENLFKNIYNKNTIFSFKTTLTFNSKHTGSFYINQKKQPTKRIRVRIIHTNNKKTNKNLLRCWT
jgi:hypothetical protein